MAHLNRCTKVLLVFTCVLVFGLLLLTLTSTSHESFTATTTKTSTLQKSVFAESKVSQPQTDVLPLTNSRTKKASLFSLQTVTDPQPPNVFSMTQDEREKFQQEAVDQFCKEHRINYLDMKGLWSSYMWLNNKTDTLYCYIPKVGCTTLKALYYLSMGLVPKKMVNATYKESAKFHYMKTQKTLQKVSASKRRQVLSTYYKFVMLRHPLERLVSGYHDKIEGVTLKSADEWIKGIIRGTYKFVNAGGDKMMAAKGGSVTISFKDMVRFMLDKSSKNVFNNEHLISFMTLCSPCQVRYNYYGNFKTFNEDAAVLVDKYGVGMDMLRSKYSDRNTTTGHLTQAYYDTLTDDLKIGLVKRLALDLDFYYHVFPSERDSHMKILRINFVLPDTRPH